MAVFRVERIKDYTVMSNHHLRNKNLSLKAKGLLSQMLSLPDDWDYTLKGLAAINKESVDAIRTAIWELEDAGYVVRTRVRDERGCLRGCDYYVYEYPQTPSSGSGGSAESVPPMLEPLASDSAVLGNPMQLNKEIQNKEKQNTDLILSEGAAVRTKVRDNIELDLLCRNQPESAPVMQEIYELVVETIQLRSPVLRLTFDPARGSFASYARQVVQNGLVSYCRNLTGKQSRMISLAEMEPTALAALEVQHSAPFDIECETPLLLAAAESQYSGVTRKGVHALALQVSGIPLTAVATRMSAPPNHVSAWISRAVHKLRNDESFLSSLHEN